MDEKAIKEHIEDINEAIDYIKARDPESQIATELECLIHDIHENEVVE